MSSGSDPAPSPIALRIANKVAYVWDVDDIATIRSKHRICGVLTGTLPHLSQQNVFLGVPLVLMPEEVALLVDIGAAHLIDDPLAFSQTPTPAQLSVWAAEQNESMKTQLAFAETKSAQESTAGSGRAMSAEALRKRAEREERKKAQAAAKAAAEGDASAGPSVSVVEPERISTPTPAPDSAASSSVPPYTVVIPASASSQAWYSPSAPGSSCTYTSLAAAREAGIWTYPENLAERARCGVFKDLWKQGYFMGGGIKFGGEYLVYPGDPLRYHSHFAATVMESPIASLRPMEIVAHGRLGTATKKAHLLCGWDDEKQEVSYLSIEWAGFG
ncbi:hypothetical protein GALMADRAFT_152639 [Galerina marginata CBS 339.88]|uniref:tRNA-splicing endonuclease subunit Sen34 n=1 Tax=Galerina marginata (strain CBS 339.88) TaxID=685588 RepID=A0A067TF90_GALM3|nr:hypothetical protein GALMADRAFT_152639 [Galerina marginata CBS 339.88]